MKQSIKSNLLHALAAAILVGMPMQQAQAAPGTLPSAPLFLSTIVEPNVFLTLDDSTSMNWEVTVPAGTGGIETKYDVFDNLQGVPVLPASGGSFRAFYHPTYINFNVVPPVSLYPEAWLLKSHEGNTTYYNPNVTYQPWSGSDASGNPLYFAADPAAVPLIPGDATTYSLLTDFTYNDGYTDLDGDGNSDDAALYVPTYFEWVDDGDGIIHAINDKGKAIIIKSGNAPFPSGRSYADEIQNFANWFVYYRTREYATKAVVGKIINNSDSNRVGLRLFNAGHIIDAATMSNSANKLTLLQAFYKSTSLGSTPARTALEATGTMFANETNTGVPSPILPEVDGGTCQQNFNILMTDGYWNGSDPTWGTKAPKDTFNTDASTALDSSIFDGDASQSNDGGNYADAFSSTLADVAMHFYETDLRTDLLDEVPERTGVDENTQQHLVNYVLSFGLTGTLDPTKDPARIDLVDPFPGWPDSTVSTNYNEKIDDLWHSAYNSRGKFIATQDSEGISSALDLAIADISERTGTAAAVAVNSAKLSTESVVYLAQFNTNRWQGNLFAFPIVDSNTGELAETAKWDASSELTNRTKARNIITFDASTSTGIPFQWANLSTTMKDDLLINPLGGVDSATIGEARLDYIRGDRSNETSGFAFRERISLLGDLVNSGPVFVGPPSLAWPDLAPFPDGTTDMAYSEFKDLYKDRQKIVYVGANDGMLHAFNDDNGEEVFGYIPGKLYSTTVNEGLHYMTDPNYIHKYYVDLSPTISDVYISTGASTNWYTILVGGLRGGGRGIFALDVTNPASFGETLAKADAMSLWEFTDADDADLGYTFSRPIIALTNAGDWVAIFGNGYNSTNSGQAMLFIVDIEKGINGWTIGTSYQKITTGVGSPGAQNGLSAPALADLDGNGTVDRAYAGDLEGNMWVFDLTSTTSGNWGKAAFKNGSDPAPLFTAPANQQITAKPVLASHPTITDTNTNGPNIMVYFGTGQYLVDGDKITTDNQSFYGIWDKSDQDRNITNLVKQQFDTTFTTGRVLTRNAVDYATAYGWYFDLTDSGERVVTSAIARADTVFFNSFVPVSDPCSQGGYGYKFAVDMDTGGSPLIAAIDSNGDSLVDDGDYVSNSNGDESTLAAVRQEGFLPEPVFIEDLAFTGDTATKIKALSTVPTGRFSWQELIF